jgi:hypothetical protein
MEQNNYIQSVLRRWFLFEHIALASRTRFSPRSVRVGLVNRAMQVSLGVPSVPETSFPKLCLPTTALDYCAALTRAAECSIFSIMLKLALELLFSSVHHPLRNHVKIPN